MGLLRPPPRGDRARTPTRASSSRASGCSRRARCSTADFEVIVSGLRKGVGSSPRDGGRRPRSGRASASRSRRRSRRSTRATTSTTASLMGDHDVLRAPAAGRGGPARGVHEGLRRDHEADDREGGLFPFTKALARGARRACPPRDTARAADDDDREDPRRAPRRARARRYVKPGDAVRRARRRRLLARVHDRAGRLLPRAGVRARLHGREPDEVRGVRGPPDLRDRRRADGAVRRRRSRRCASCSASSRRRPACATTAPRRRLARHLPPGRARAVHRARRLRPGDRQPHVHGRRQRRARVGRRRDRVRGARALGAHLHGGARSRSASSSTGACARA